MQFSKALGSFVAVAAGFVALTASSESRAGDETLASVACTGGNVTVTAANSQYHVNAEAPWKWTKGTKVSVDEHAAKFKGDKCEGTISAFMCTNDKSSCKSFKVEVK